MFGGGSLAEGWACYVCDLMEEIGFLTPLERIAAAAHARPHRRPRRRRPVDPLRPDDGAAGGVALRAIGRTCPQAAAKAESVKNSMFPGTAVMYWLGTRGIHDLRADVQAREGAAFSLRGFHDRFLSHGAIPVALIARLMLADGAAR